MNARDEYRQSPQYYDDKYNAGRKARRDGRDYSQLQDFEWKRGWLDEYDSEVPAIRASN